MNKRQIYEFQRNLENIRHLKGKATELISLYVPPTKQVSDVVAYLRNEYSQSSNIKSKSTMKGVTSAIESIMSRLKNINKIPENGVVFFFGMVNDKMVHYILEPPEEISTFKYRCDSHFYMDILDDLCKSTATYGLLVIDTQEATIGVLRGSKVMKIEGMESMVPRKHTQGGWSQARFARLHEEAKHNFFKKVGEHASNSLPNVEKILIGGPGSTKDDFLKGNFLHHELKKKILPTFNVGYTDESGLRMLVDEANETIKDLEISKEKTLMNTFLTGIAKEEPVTYGELEIREALFNGIVDILLISVKASPELIDEFIVIANQYGSRIEYISTGFYEGDVLLTFGGFGAILRY